MLLLFPKKTQRLIAIAGNVDRYGWTHIAQRFAHQADVARVVLHDQYVTFAEHVIPRITSFYAADGTPIVYP